ncbi:MAG: hypothetical protein GXO55_00560 [Chloroflexi bacterium]|nr:hypothetical protein [Chloroflexota bacterium]
MKLLALLEGTLFMSAGGVIACHKTWGGLAIAAFLALLANLVRRASMSEGRKV